MSRTEISEGVFRRHAKSERIDAALESLQQAGAAYPESVQTRGRSSKT
jgi:hypothetical protein